MTPHILIAGGGVAALEALIALHELAPDRQRVTLLAPEPDFVYTKRVAFVVPSTVAWSLPLYELAVMTARDIWSAGIDDVELVFVTPEARPLEAFGAGPSAVVAELLEEEGIEFIGSTDADVGHGFVLAGDRRIDAGRTLALPIPAGPAIAGLPADPQGFIPVDEHGRVQGVEDVYAAGDATTSPIKQGGLAAQQAVAAAEAIIARHGADLDPQPFRPVLRGMLMTGGQNRWLRAPAGATPGNWQAATRALWWPPTKIATRYLAPYLMGREEAELLAAAPEGAQPVERELELLRPDAAMLGSTAEGILRHAHRSVMVVPDS